MRGVGTDEALIEAIGEGNISTLQWRKPLSIEKSRAWRRRRKCASERGRP